MDKLSLRQLKYIRIGDRSLECGKIISVIKCKTMFRRRPSLLIAYDGRDEYFGLSFFFASLWAIPSTQTYKYPDELSRDEMYHFIARILTYQHDLQNKLMAQKQ